MSSDCSKFLKMPLEQKKEDVYQKDFCVISTHTYTIFMSNQLQEDHVIITKLETVFHVGGHPQHGA